VTYRRVVFDQFSYSAPHADDLAGHSPHVLGRGLRLVRRWGM